MNMSCVITHTHTHTQWSPFDLELGELCSSHDKGVGGLIPAASFWADGFVPSRPRGNTVGTTGYTLNEIWCVEITCRCAPPTDLCPRCVSICDQRLTRNPPLNGLTIERRIDPVSLLAKGSRAWHSSRVCPPSAGSRPWLPWFSTLSPAGPVR